MSGVQGVSDVLARFANAAKLGEAAVKTAQDRLGEEVRDTAKELVPVVTGTLRDSITYEDGQVYSDVEYAPFVEYGTSDTDAQPYLRPAADTANVEGAAEAAANVMRGA